MKGSLVICAVAAAVGSAIPEARAAGLAVDAGVGYRTWSRGDVTLSRSFVQVVPSYTAGRLRLAAPVAVAFRGTQAPFSFANPFAFKSDDWVNLDIEASYRAGDTVISLYHDSLQLLSSGQMPRRHFGDVETDNRLLIHHTVARVGGARLNAVGGYWGIDRWTETEHGHCRGPVLGVGLAPRGDEGLAPHGLLLVGSESKGRFVGGQFALRYRRASWQLDAVAEARRYPSGDRSLFTRDERRLSLALSKSLR